MPGMFDESQEDRTENASAYRREEFRKQGSVALSREVLSVALLLSVGVAFKFGISHFAQDWGVLTQTFFKFDHLSDSSRESISQTMNLAFHWWGKVITPFFVMALLGGFVAAVRKSAGI